MAEDPISLSKTALEFREERYSADAESPRVKLLRHLGVLHPSGPNRLMLCGGVIGEMVQEMSQSTELARLGSVADASGIRRFEQADLQISDDDVVVVHMSDLHVGSDFGFSIRIDGQLLNDGQADLADLIRRDLERLKLANRIDALVISGDLSCVGSMDEFRAARAFLLGLLGQLNLDRSRLIFIAGNHDVEWKKNSLNTQLEPRVGSLSNFRTTLELFDKNEELGCQIITIPSRSGKRIVQLVGLDSNYVEGPAAAGVGYVGRTTLDAATSGLAAHIRNGRDAAGGEQEVATWLIVHHHILPVTSADVSAAREKRVSVMGNASGILSWMSSNEVELVLHGHEHQPSVTWMHRWVGHGQRLTFRPLTVLGAGSCGARPDRLGPIGRNHYFVLIRRPKEVVVRSRVMGDEGLSFVAHNDLSVPLA
jgi:3',5'-cyclic AMP phosphodiesterase CpdA